MVDLKGFECVHRDSPGELEGRGFEVHDRTREQRVVGASDEERRLGDEAGIRPAVRVGVLDVPHLDRVLALSDLECLGRHAAVPGGDVHIVDPQLHAVRGLGRCAPSDLEIGGCAGRDLDRPLDAGYGIGHELVCASKHVLAVEDRRFERVVGRAARGAGGPTLLADGVVEDLRCPVSDDDGHVEGPVNRFPAHADALSEGYFCLLAQSRQ